MGEGLLFISLKVALYDFFKGPLAPLNGQFMEKANLHNRTKHKDFSMGPSVKCVLPIIDSISNQKIVFFPPQGGHKGGGGVGGLRVFRTQKIPK